MACTALRSCRWSFSYHTSHLVQWDSWCQVGHAPCGAGLDVRVDIGARTKFDGDVKWCLAIAAQVADGRHGLSQLIDVFKVDRKEPIAASRSSQGFDVASEPRGPD